MNTLQLANTLKEGLRTGVYSEEQKAETLIELGFTKTPQARRLRMIKELKGKHEEYFKLYEEKYPLLNFFPREILNEVRRVFDLEDFLVSEFTEEIPDRNLQELEVCCIDDKDKETTTDRGLEFYGVDRARAEEEVNKIPEYEKEVKKEGKVTEEERLDRSPQGWTVAYSIPVSSESRDILRRANKLKDILDNERPLDLRILAPDDMFDEDAIALKRDPIVYQPVKGGVLIITAWGAEGEYIEKFIR